MEKAIASQPTLVKPKHARLTLTAAARRRYLLFVILVAPAFALRLLTAAYPIFQTIVLSLTNLDLIKNTNDFVGLQNFQIMANDFGVRGSLEFTLVFVFGSTFISVGIGLLIALFLNAAFFGRTFARTINLIPWVIPTIVAGYAFRWLLDDQFGLLPNWIFDAFGIRPAFFISPFSARLTVILVSSWKDAPFFAIVFLAGLQGVPLELYDAAKVDGANPWQRFWNVTFPLLLPLTITMVLFRLVWSLAGFDLVYGLTQGGPGVTTTVLALQVFREGILFFKFGFASAISVVLLLLVALIGGVGLWLFRKADVTY